MNKKHALYIMLIASITQAGEVMLYQREVANGDLCTANIDHESIRHLLRSNTQLFRIHDDCVQKHYTIKDAQLFYASTGFFVGINKQLLPIASHDVSQDLCPIKNVEKLKKLLQHGYLSLSKLSNGEYKLNVHVRGIGGGAAGATVGFWSGKSAVYVVGYGAIGIISGVSGYLVPGLTPFVAKALHITCGPAIEVASNTVGLAGSLALGSATGPV